MDARLRLAVGALACVLLAACADDDAMTPPATSPNVVQNNTYNNVTYQMNVTTASTNDASAPSSGASAASIGDVPVATTPLPALDAGAARDTASTGIASCDAYLARVETCSRRMLPNNGESNAAFHRITSSLDTTRRAWRGLAQSASSTSLARTCTDAMRSYNESLSNYCPIEPEPK